MQKSTDRESWAVCSDGETEAAAWLWVTVEGYQVNGPLYNLWPCVLFFVSVKGMNDEQYELFWKLCFPGYKKALRGSSGGLNTGTAL